MIHASVELVEAMRGTFLGADESDDTGPHALAVCGAAEVKWGCAIWGWCGDRGDGRAEFTRDIHSTPLSEIADACDVERIDCPMCLRLVRDAIPPVRWDALEERGLVSMEALK